MIVKVPRTKKIKALLVNVRDAANLRPWLVSVAANEAKRVVRKRRRQAEIEASGLPHPDERDLDPSEELERIEEPAEEITDSMNVEEAPPEVLGSRSSEASNKTSARSASSTNSAWTSR